MNTFIGKRSLRSVPSIAHTRELDDGERTVLAIKKADGKRPRYREPA